MKSSLIFRESYYLWLVFLFFCVLSTVNATESKPMFNMENGKVLVSVLPDDDKEWCNRTINLQITLKDWHAKNDVQAQLKNTVKKVGQNLLSTCQQLVSMSFKFYRKDKLIAIGHHSLKGSGVRDGLTIVDHSLSGPNSLSSNIMALIEAKNQLKKAKTSKNKTKAEDKMQLVIEKMKVNQSARNLDTPNTHKVSISTKQNCIVKDDKGVLGFKFCTIGESTQFDFIEEEKDSNQFRIQFSSSPEQCLTSLNKELKLWPCDKASIWSLFRLPATGYEIRLSGTENCLDYNLRLRSCWGLASNRQHEQIFRLQTNEGEFNDKLGQTLLAKGVTPTKREYDPYYELTTLIEKVSDTNILPDVLFNIARQQVKRISQNESYRTVAALDAALALTSGLALRGEHDYAVLLAQSIEPLFAGWVDQSQLDDAEYRSSMQTADFLRFSRRLMFIYAKSNRFDLAIPWAELQFKYPATGVHYRHHVLTPIEPTIELVEIALQNLDKPYDIDEEQLEIFIWQALEMPIKQRKNTKARALILKNMPDSWNRNYGHKPDPYIPRLDHTLLKDNNAQYYARVHMYLGYLYARWAEKDPSYLKDAYQLLDKSFEILSIYAGSPPYWMGRLYSYLTYWAQVAKAPEKQKLYSKIGLEKLQDSQANGVYSELRFQFYETQLNLFINEKNYKSAATIAKKVYQEFDKNISVLDVTSELNQQLISRYRKLLNKSMTVLYASYQNSESKNQPEILEQSLMLAQRLRLSAAGAASQQLKSRLMDTKTSINKDSSSLIRQFQDAKKHIIDLNASLLKDPFTQPSKKILTELRLATELYTGLRKETQQKTPWYAEVIEPQIFSLAALQKTLSPKQGLLLYRLEEDSTFLWALTSQKATWWRLQAKPSEINEQIIKLKESIKGQKEFDEKTAEKLYQNVLAQADVFFKNQSSPIDTLFIEADGELQNIPLTLFRGSLENQSKQWFGGQYALITIPNVAMMTLPKHPQLFGNKEKDSFYFAIADPANLKTTHDISETNAPIKVTDPFSRAGSGDICNMMSLPDTRNEVTSIAKALNIPDTNLLLGAAATEQTLRNRSLVDYRILHFATHAVLSKNSQKESGLVLTPNCPRPITTSRDDDGLLSVSEIATLKLSADSVILSACDTAGGNEAGGDALSGIAQAFLYAGAQSLVVSHWPVDSAVTSALMIRFTKLWLQEGLTKSMALKQAMTEIRAQKPEWAHPRYWAPFIVVSAQP